MPSGTQKQEILNKGLIQKLWDRIRFSFRRFLEETSFIRHYVWKYRRYVGVGLIAVFVVDGLEVIPPIFLKDAIDITTTSVASGMSLDFLLNRLLWVAIGYFAVSILQAICRYGWRMFLIRASMFSGRDIRKKYAHHLFGMSSSFYDRHRIGDLMSLATSDVEAVRMSIGHGILLVADALVYFMVVPVAMWMLSPKLTLLAFIPLPFIPWIVMKNEREVYHRFNKVQECFGRLSALVQEGLAGNRIVKSFAKEDVQVRRLKEMGEEFSRLNLELARYQAAFAPTLDFTMSLGLVLLLFYGGWDMIHNGTHAVTLGTFVAFQRYIQKMVSPMASIGMAVNFFQRAVTSTGRLKNILAIETDVPEAAQPQLPVNFATQAERTLGRVEFKNLSFRFPGTDKLALSGINLTIEPGERVAFIGAIGGGKSALLSLLPRLYPVERGMLFIDGIDVNDWPIQQLRKQVGYVSQDVLLFSETVTENVALGLAGWAAEREQMGLIEQATRSAAVHEDVLSLASSYQTRLGERGVNLSGGQKQRLTIARALAKEPPILVLDDALSSVDVQTEEKILQGLRSRPGRNTEIIAAHRISTIKDADRIIVLEGGVIRQAGSHQELLKDRRGAYMRYYTQQQLKEELDQYSESLDQPREAPVVIA